MEKSEKDQAQKEYATQHFGFTPISFIDEFTEETLDYVSGSLVAMKKQVQKKLPGKVDNKTLDKAFETVDIKYRETVEKLFEKLGTFLCKNILVVPSHVLLPEDKPWDSAPRNEASSKLAAANSEMSTIRHKIKTALYKKSRLKSELENIRSTCLKQESVIQQEVDMKKRVGEEEWSDNLDFVSLQRKALTRKTGELADLLALNQEDPGGVVAIGKRKRKRVDMDNEAEFGHLKVKARSEGAGEEMAVTTFGDSP